MNETWKQIPGWDYEASDLGRIRNAKTGLVLKPFRRGSKRYVGVDLWRERQGKREYVHHLVLKAFVGPCPEGFEAYHGNDVGNDNRAENLKWATRQENIANRKHAKGNQYTRRKAA